MSIYYEIQNGLTNRYHQLKEYVSAESLTNYCITIQEKSIIDGYLTNLAGVMDVRMRLTYHRDIKIGTEVEIQWRIGYQTPWSWWKGAVESIYIDPESTASISHVISDSYSSPNEPNLAEGLNAIRIKHPQFHEQSQCKLMLTRGHATYVSPDAIIIPTDPGLGQVGGMRKVECLCHAMLWKLNFTFLHWEGDQEALNWAGLGMVRRVLTAGK